MILVFVLGYLAIALEHPIRIDKTPTALIIGALTWALYALAPSTVLNQNDVTTVEQLIVKGEQGKLPENLAHYVESETHKVKIESAHEPEKMNEFKEESSRSFLSHFVTHELAHHLGHIAEILFFLLGAMTLVEMVDAHEGFAVITDKIKTTNRSKLLWIICILTFFFSAALDNLTTSIVMVSLLRKLIGDKQDRWLFAGMVVIAANAGGAWSPIGDVTTTMLWIGGQITAGSVVSNVILPSLVCLLVPLTILSFRLKGNVARPIKAEGAEHYIEPTTHFERNLVFFLGVSLLLFVPIFKTITHLPPYLGMLFGLGVLGVVTEIIHRKKNHEAKHALSILGVLNKIDTASVLFFLGILVAVSSLQSAGHLTTMATLLEKGLGDVYAINLVIGVLSSIVDNVPLVAASQGMYTIAETGVTGWDSFFVTDGTFWEFLAYCAGTGGSALIIGSAAGVAVMGMERIDFIWYFKKISLLALIGYLSGAAVYILVSVI